jgi:biopolymer transport protein ExbD
MCDAPDSASLGLRRRDGGVCFPRGVSRPLRWRSHVPRCPHRSRPVAEINITPLVDVMLVLLVIFLIASPVLAHRITVDLPVAVPPPKIPPPPPEIITLTVAADGTYLWNGEALIGAALAPQLRLEAHRTPQPELAIDASRSVRYQEIATVLAAANEAGLKRVGFTALSR